jgi:hypothetical protein
MTTFGEINWTDDVAGGGDKKNTKDLFLRLNEGDNELRLITQPFQYLVHKVKKDESNPKDFGQKVSCSMIHGSCPLCDKSDKAKARWLLGVISNGSYKILDISFAVFDQIRGLAKNKHWGDPTKYIINVVVNKQGGPMGYYKVQPLSKEPLSATEQSVKDNDLDFEDLKRRVTPLSPEQVKARVEKITGVAMTSETVVKTATKAAPVDTSPEDDSSEFPDYAAQ